MKANFRILAGCCVLQEPQVLAAYLRSLKALQVPAGCTLNFGFVNDGGPEQLAQLAEVEPAIVLPAEPRPADAAYAVGADTHHWTVPTFEHLARQKQRLLDYAIEAGYTHVFFVDSDLLMEPATLVSLWETRGNIVNAVFWSQWQPQAPPQPQCWLSHPYGMAGLGLQEHEFIRSLVDRQCVRVIGGGACVLIATEAAKRGVCYHPRLPNLPPDGMWQGEDRTFALRATRLHERQLADAWPDVFHAYRPEQRTQDVLDDVWSVLNAPPQMQANYGDQVSLVLEPLEDAQIRLYIERKPEVACIRGRLGALPLAPELEAQVLEMQPGDEALVNIVYPYWHVNPAYRNKSKIVKMKLVAIKPYSMAPVIADAGFAGVPV